MSHKPLARCGLLLGATILSGCATSNGLLTSLEDLNTEAEKKGYCKIPQYRVISVPGLLPFPDVGMVDFYKSSRLPSTAIGLNPKKSVKLVATIGGDGSSEACDQTCLATIRDAFVVLQTLAVSEIDQRLQGVIQRAENASAVNPPPPKAASNSPTVEQAAVPEPVDVTTESEDSEEPDAKAEMPSASVDENDGDDGIATNRTLKHAATSNDRRGRLTAAAGPMSPLPVQAGATPTFGQQYAHVVSLLRHHGVMVYRWESASSISGGVGIGDYIAASGSKKKKTSGFALVSGLRISSLYLGEDFADEQTGLDTFHMGSRYANRIEITTHLMQARYIAYASALDLESYSTARVKVTKDLLTGSFSRYLANEELALNYIAGSVSSLSNMGVMGEVKREFEQINWDAEFGSGIEKQDGWHTFYAVKSDVSDLQDLARNKPGFFSRNVWSRLSNGC